MLPARLRRGDGASGRGLARDFLHQHADLVGQLRALGNPVLHARGVELDALLVTLGNRVVEAEALERAAVALVAVVGGDDVVEGTLLGAAAGQANLDHGSVYSLLEWPGPSRPFMPRIMPFRPPPASLDIIFSICWYCLSSGFTAAGVVPEPRATRA